MEIKIRPYQTQDAETIVSILNYYIANSTALYDYELRTLEKQQAIFEEKLAKGFPVIVATIYDRAVGFGYYSEFRFREAYKFTVEHSVYVMPNEHGKGVGKALLLHALSGLWDMGYAYGVIAGAGPIEFYRKACGAIEIPDSVPGIYQHMLMDDGKEGTR